jgi:putative peptide zinc metalloprotease protein
VNFAYAYAHDCNTGCQAVAVSFQVVLQDKNAKSQAPQNVALAINYQCHACGVFAYADQYVVDVPRGTRLPSMTRHQLDAIRRQADSDVRAQLPFSELDGRLHALATELATDVDAGLQNARVPEMHERSNEHHRQAGQA